MAHFAKVINGMVTRVIVAEQDFVDNYDDGAPGSPWVQCSYNTHEGQHLLGGTPLRKNMPSAGWYYDETNDAFYPPKPGDENGEFTSWTLNTDTFKWDPPVAFPTKQTKVIDGNEEAIVSKWEEQNQRYVAGKRINNSWDRVNFIYRWNPDTSEWVDI